MYTTVNWEVIKEKTTKFFFLLVFIYGPSIHFREPTLHFPSIASLSLVLMMLKKLASDFHSGFLPWHFPLFRGNGKYTQVFVFETLPWVLL
jgi:hypothetical protein